MRRMRRTHRQHMRNIGGIGRWLAWVVRHLEICSLPVSIWKTEHQATGEILKANSAIAPSARHITCPPSCPSPSYPILPPTSPPASLSLFPVVKSLSWFVSFSLSLFFKDFIYLLMRIHREERDRDTGRGRSRFHAGSLTWDLIPGLQDHTLGQRQH